RAQRGRLVDRPAVVVDRAGPLARVDRGEETAPAQGRDRQARVPYQPGRRLDAVRLHRLAPQTYLADGQLRAVVEEFGQRELTYRHLVDGEPGQITERTQRATPYRDSRVFMRVSASAGSGNRPSVSASSYARVKCGSDRADWRPPTMVKCS